MSASVNKVTILGNLGKDPITRYMPSGDAVTNITVATTESWKDKDGNRQEKTEWHRITFFGKVAEIAGKYLKKGNPVYVEGKLQTTKYADKKTGEEKYTTDIIASDLKLLGGKPEGGRSDNNPGASESNESEKPKTGFDDMDDDIPF